jgi:hypothetical protein
MKIFDNRLEMLAQLPKNLTIAELGVFRGEFAKQILDICQPETLVLIDNWGGQKQGSGDADGNNYAIYNSEELYQHVLNELKDIKNIKIIREMSTVLESFPDNHFDAIYIDADHSYAGVKTDLLNANKKVKNGGYILGHDYNQNMEKAKTVYTFGVKQAVDEFCETYKQEISMKAMDGCISYGIILKK